MKKEPTCILAPSMLSSDFTQVGNEVKSIEETTAQWIHLDIMDGSFVPTITFGAKFVSDVRSITNLVLDTHLMVVNPEKHIVNFAKAGSDYITVHSEAALHLNSTVNAIHSEGKMAGVSIVPTTPVSSIELILEEIQQVLIMSVNPGFGGQTFIENSLRKIAELAQLRKKYNLDFKIAVDGGLNEHNAPKVIAAGADVLIMGSAFFAVEDRVAFARRVQGL